MPFVTFRSVRFVFLLAVPCLMGAAQAQTATEANEAAAAPVVSQHSIDKLVAPVLKTLKLGDAEKEKQVASVLGRYFETVAVWHQQVDGDLAKLWSAWADARGTAHQDEAKAAEFAAKIDAVYAQFRPQHDRCVAELGKILAPAQVEAVENTLTREPGLERTYNAFLQIVPTLTPEQMAYIHSALGVARDQALDTLSKKEKIDLFKKQKVKVQLYLQSLGYDWKTVYGAYAKKLQAQGKKEE